MGVMSMKWNEAEMTEVLTLQLMPGEALLAGIYASFVDTSILGSRLPVIGYVGLTDQGRLLVLQGKMIGSEEFAVDLAFVRKMKIRQNIFQKLAHGRDVYLEYNGGTGSGKLRFVVTQKIAGSKFPHQQENAERILQELELVQQSLP